MAHARCTQAAVWAAQGSAKQRVLPWVVWRGHRTAGPHVASEPFSVSSSATSSIGLAKKFIWVFHTIVRRNPNELFGQPDTFTLSCHHHHHHLQNLFPK